MLRIAPAVEDPAGKPLTMLWSNFHIALSAFYLAALIGVSLYAGRRTRDSSQFLDAAGTLPLWVCIIASIAANCGSLDVTAMMALGAQYGILAAHFYWIGAVPALLVLAFWLLPRYAQGHDPSILAFIERHYGARTRALVALCMAITMLLLSGVCLCAAAQALHAFLGWSFLTGVLLTAPLVLLYTYLGGVRATIYTELLHFALTFLAIAPLVFLLIHDFGGLRNLFGAIPADRLHAWKTLPLFAPHAPMDRFGLIFGLGLVLSFGYWSTDFVFMQRALAVRRGADVRVVPLAVATAKIVFAFLIVLPGIAAPLVVSAVNTDNWNAVLPALVFHYYGPSWAALGIVGIFTSLVATFANNLSGFSAAWVLGVRSTRGGEFPGERQSIWMSRLVVIAATAASVGGAFIALENQSLMEYMQMIFSTFNAPLFALVTLAATLPRHAARGGLSGFVAGLVAGVLQQVLAHLNVLHYGSQMSANFYCAVLGFCVALIVTLATGLRHKATDSAEREHRMTSGLVCSPTVLFVFALLILGTCGALNLLFW